MYLLWYLFSFLKIIRTCLAQTYCNDESVCAGSWLQGSSSIYCYGFSSCSPGNTILTSSSFYGYGAYAAYNTSRIHVGNYAYCYGESSCSNCDTLNVYDNLYCRGYRSCSQSIISVGHTSNGYRFNS